MTKLVPFLLVLATFVCLSVQKQSETGCCCEYRCPPGWARFEYRCYKFSGSLGNWQAAEDYCVSKSMSVDDEVTGSTLQLNSHLASINSDEEQEFVFNLWRDSLTTHTPSPNINVNSMKAQWIGYKKVGNAWVWTDGSCTGPSCFTAWAKYGRQPSGDGTVAHMWVHSQIAARGDPQGYWNDWTGTPSSGGQPIILPFTCEMPTIKHCE